MKQITVCGLLLALAIGITACGNPCANGHTWKEADCTTAQTCSVCGITEGKPLGHNIPEYTVTTEATCSVEGEEQGACTRCGVTQSRSIAKKPHTNGEWEITRQATATSPGQKTLCCAVCGAEIKNETFTLSAEEIEADFIKSCASYSYQDIARNPDSYIGQCAKFTGKVIQVMESGTSCQYRVNVTQSRYSWSDTIYVTYTKSSISESRILEDDIITIYGTLAGNYTYETVMHSELTIPSIDAKYIKIN